MRGEDVIVVYGDSAIALPREDRGITRILQRFGRSLFQVGKRSSGAFQVETPLLITGVKGTEFAVTVSGDGGSVTVLEGIVETRVARSSAVVLLEAGESVDVASPIQPSLSPHATPVETRTLWQSRSDQIPAANTPDRPAAVPTVRGRPIGGKQDDRTLPGTAPVEPVKIERAAPAKDDGGNDPAEEIGAVATEAPPPVTEADEPPQRVAVTAADAEPAKADLFAPVDDAVKADETLARDTRSVNQIEKEGF